MTDQLPSKEVVTFNMNESVRVRLTDLGREALRRQHFDLYASIGKTRPPEYRPPREDANGWSTWQLWSLMHDLGHLCYMGGGLPFETNIQFERPAQPPSAEQ